MLKNGPIFKIQKAGNEIFQYVKSESSYNEEQTQKFVFPRKISILDHPVPSFN